MVAALHHHPTQPVAAPDDDGEVPVVILVKISEEVDAVDRKMLEYVAKHRQVQLDDKGQPVDPFAPPIDPARVYLYGPVYGLLEIEKDPSGRLYLCASSLLDRFLNPPPSRVRRRRR